MVAESEMIVQTRDYLVTENVLNPLASPMEIANFVKKAKTTGQLTWTTNQGGVRSVMVVERTKASEDEANAIRQIMGMTKE